MVTIQSCFLQKPNLKFSDVWCCELSRCVHKGSQSDVKQSDMDQFLSPKLSCIQYLLRCVSEELKLLIELLWSAPVRVL